MNYQAAPLRALVALLLPALLLLAAACSREKQPSATPAASPPAEAAAPAPDAAPAPAPAPHEAALEPVPCATFKVDDSQAGRPVSCGYLAVLEDRGRPAGRTIKLAVAIFKAENAPPDEPPLIWLDGGPGGASVESMASVVTGPLGREALPGRSLVADRDLVLIDQRGTGFSQPSLRCTETEVFPPGLSHTPDPREDIPAYLKAITDCRDRLARQGIDLSAYTSAENAADINDLRTVLGVPQVNLYGVSYGTRLALTVMRDFPETVRAAVLDSPLPLQSNLYVDVGASAQRAFDLLFAECNASAACRAAYPNLDRVFAETVGRLNAGPIPAAHPNPRTGASERLYLSGDGLVEVLFQLLYSGKVLPALPVLISLANSGNVDPLLTVLRQVKQEESMSLGMHLSVMCAEETPFNPPEAVAAAAAALRPELSHAFGVGESDDMTAVCAIWPSRPPNPAENEPVQSAVPTLILSGRNDPITPPAYAELIARTLPRSTVVTFPATAHGVALSGAPCGFDIMSAFLKDPAARPNTACAGGLKLDPFILPPTPARRR